MEKNRKEMNIIDTFDPPSMSRDHPYNDRALTKLVLELFLYLIFLTIITTCKLFETDFIDQRLLYPIFNSGP